jgi:glycogen(starch) synthase
LPSGAVLHSLLGTVKEFSNMKVLLVGDFPPPHGGVAVHVEVLFRAVRAHGGICEVLDIGKGQLPADGVVPAGGLVRFTALLGQYAARGYQIHVHTSGANPKSWMLAGICAAAGAVSQKPPLITFHSGLGPAWIAQSAARRKTAAAVAGRFGTVIAVSDEIRDNFIRCGVAPEKLEVLPAFSHSFLEPGAPPAGFETLRAEAAPLFSAMLAPGKVYGHEILLDAFARVHRQLPSARLAVYGPGSDAVKAPGVIAYGELHRPQALAVMAKSDIFIRPTLADGDSVSVREALALGRIVVATRVGNRPPEARLVTPGDAASLAEGLLSAAADLRARPVREAASRAGDCVQRLLALYGYVAEEAPAAQAQQAQKEKNAKTTAGEAACVASAAS